jgi:hypothetical protein
MTDEERLKAMREGAEIAKRVCVQIVSKFPLRAEVGAHPTSREYEHFKHCAATLNALDFEDEDFIPAPPETDAKA